MRPKPRRNLTGQPLTTGRHRRGASIKQVGRPSQLLRLRLKVRFLAPCVAIASPFKKGRDNSFLSHQSSPMPLLPPQSHRRPERGE